MTFTSIRAGRRPKVRLTAFICGCGHSGTTLLATMLAQHSQIHVPLKETNAFLGGDAQMHKELDQLKRDTLAAGKSVAVEKTPRHVRFISRIREAKPRAKFILTVRDGRDSVASLGNRMEGDYEGALKRWMNDNAHVIAELGKNDVFLLRYEDFIVAPKRWLKRICRFLGVKFEPGMLDYHKRPVNWFGTTEIKHTSGVGKEHEHLRNWQVNQPLFDGRGRWKEDLPAEFVERLGTGAPRETMRLFGYDINWWERLRHHHAASGRRGEIDTPARRFIRRVLEKATGRRWSAR